MLEKRSGRGGELEGEMWSYEEGLSCWLLSVLENGLLRNPSVWPGKLCLAFSSELYTGRAAFVLFTAVPVDLDQSSGSICKSRIGQSVGCAIARG